MSKAAGCLRNTRTWGGGSSLFFIATFFPATQISCPLSTQPGTRAGGGCKGDGRNRWCPWGVQTIGWFRQFCPTANRFGEGRGEGISVICCLTRWLARAPHNNQLGQSVRFSRALVPPFQDGTYVHNLGYLGRQDRSRLLYTHPKSHTGFQNTLFSSPIFLSSIEVNVRFLGTLTACSVLMQSE